MNFRTVMVAAALTLGLSVSASAQQAMTPADVAKIEKEVSAAAQDYIHAMSSLDTQQVVKLFSNPTVYTSPKGSTARTLDEIKTMYDDIFRDLKKTPYDHSEFRNTKICVIGPNSAMISGGFVRVAKDGSLMMDGTTVYLFTRVEGGWKIVANLGTPKLNKAVDCG